ncbi:MAG: acyl carrier protein [Prevotella sp.]|nr:acyl carrier protein [Prevotella sp.]
MKREEIEQKVNEVLIDVLGIDQAEIRNESKLEDDLNTDSLDAVEIVMELEHEFGISIPDEKMYGSENEICTVKDVYDLVEGLL